MPDGALGVEEITADEVGRGHVLVAGDGDERLAQSPSHVLNEPRLATARRAFEHDRHAVGVGGGEQPYLVGRYLLDAKGTVWHDGPLTLAVRHGAICYLDEIVEARQDTTVVIHPLTDDRRILPLEKKGELVTAHADFQLVISYNPGYQSVLKDLKESTKQRFGAIDFAYPAAEIEAEIIAHEAGVDRQIAALLVVIAERSRNLKGHGLDEGASTRMLIYAGRLIARGIAIAAACRIAIVLPISDDDDIRDALTAAIAAAV